MSGWDMSSTPTWGPNDGPEESTQSFPVPGAGTRDFGQDFDAQDFADAGPSSYPQRTPGASMRDLPRRESRGRHSAPVASYGSDDAYSAENGFGQDRDRDPGFGQDNGFGHDNPFGQDHGFGHDNPLGQDNGFGQDNPFGQDNGFGHDNPLGQDNGFGQDRDRGAAPAPGRTPDWGTGPDAGQNWGAAAPDAGDDGWGRPAGRSVPPWEERPEQDFGISDRQEPVRREPGRPGFRGPDDLPGDQGFPGQPEPGFPVRDSDARMDPALQDFFAPQAGRQEAGRPEPGRLDGGRFEGRTGPGPAGPGPAGSGPSGPGLPSLDQPGPRRGAPNPYAELEPSRIGQPSTNPRFRQTDGWGVSDGRPAPARSGGGNGTGPRPAPGGARHQQSGGLSGATVTIGLAVIVIAVVAIGGYLLLHHGNSAKPSSAASHTAQTTHAATAKPKKSASAKGKSTSKPKGGTTAGTAYVLSTPTTAGGYPQGTDPHFLETATVTAKSIANAVSSGGAGTTKGNLVSAAYRLPTNSQVITFVGYQGTFTPSKVATILGSLGTDQNIYPAGANGGTFGCANTPASGSTPSGAVCVWATTSTLGITEFFNSTGPEALTASQEKGAADAAKLRLDVEKKKS